MAKSNRYRISESNRQGVFETLKNGNDFLGNINAEVKNAGVFLYTLALGYTLPLENLSKASDWFAEDDLSREMQAIVAACVYYHTKNIDDILDFDKLHGVADQMSNAGFEELQEQMKSYTLNPDLKLIANLDDTYQKLQEQGELEK